MKSLRLISTGRIRAAHTRQKNEVQHGPAFHGSYRSCDLIIRGHGEAHELLQHSCNVGWKFAPTLVAFLSWTAASCSSRTERSGRSTAQHGSSPRINFAAAATRSGPWPQWQCPCRSPGPCVQRSCVRERHTERQVRNQLTRRSTSSPQCRP